MPPFSLKKSILLIFSVWTFLCVFNVILHVVVHIIYKWRPEDLHCRINFGDERFQKIMHIGFSCLNFLSMFMLFFAYGKIYRFIGRHNNAVHPSLQASRNSQRTLGIHEMKASRVLFATVFSFCVSWIPAGVLTILEFGFDMSIPSTARSLPLLFASISAWLNPVIHGVMNRAMRKEYRNTLFCRKEN